MRNQDYQESSRLGERRAMTKGSLPGGGRFSRHTRHSFDRKRGTLCQEIKSCPVKTRKTGSPDTEDKEGPKTPGGGLVNNFSFAEPGKRKKKEKINLARERKNQQKTP